MFGLALLVATTVGLQPGNHKIGLQYGVLDRSYIVHVPPAHVAVYAPCTTGANVVPWKLSGSGHVWPGRDVHFEHLLGRPTHLVNANEEIWGFFKAAGAHR